MSASRNPDGLHPSASCNFNTGDICPLTNTRAQRGTFPITNSIASTDYFSSLTLFVFTLCELSIFTPQMGDVWGELHPKLKDLFENTNEASSRSSSQTHTSRGQKTCAVIGPA